MNVINNDIQNQNDFFPINDDPFISKLNISLNNLRNIYDLVDSSNIQLPSLKKKIPFGYYFSSDSPVLSNTNSENECSGDEDCFEDSSEYFPKHQFRKLTLNTIKRSLDKYYDSDDKYSSELDILISFINGQKHMCIKAKNIIQFRLNLLMFPSLIAAAAMSVFAPFIQEYEYSAYLISSLNALITICMSIIHFLKLESTCDNFLKLSSQYDKLENSLQMICSKLIFIDGINERKELIIKGLGDFETKMTELKEINHCLLPSAIRNIYPIISHMNIFSFIKRMETYKKNIMLKFKDVKNEIRYILWKYGSDLQNDPEYPMHKRLATLSTIKNQLKDELLHYRTAYGYMDELILKEIKQSEKISLFKYLPFSSKNQNNHMNPVIHSYLEVLFER
jgi:hypothetical protein